MPIIATSNPRLSQKDIATRIAILPRIKAEICNRSFEKFGKEFWEEQSNDTLKWSWHMGYICEQLEKVAYRVANYEPNEADMIINVPPGTSKTSLALVLFPVWCWTKWPWMKFITVSYASDLSLESAEKSRDIITSEKFKEYYPHLQLKKDKAGKSNYMLQERVYNKKTGRLLGVKNRGTRYSTSVKAKVTGFHAHIILIDDPLNPQQATSKVELDATNAWLANTLYNREAEKGVTTRVTIMQRVHQNDPTGYFLKRSKDDPNYPLQHICLPGEIKVPAYAKLVHPPELKDNYVDGLLDPTRMPYDILMGLKARMGQYAYAGQVGQSPTPPGGNMFKVDKFEVLRSIPEGWKIDKVIRYWDKAATAGAGAYTVGLKMARIHKGIETRYVILDVVRGQWASEQREERIKQVALIDGIRVHVWVEQEPGSGGKESAKATIKNLIGTAAVYAEVVRGDKEYRADPFSVAVNNGHVWLMEAKWNYELIEEYRFFPNSTYKDQVDAGGAAFAKLTTLKRAGMMWTHD